MNQVLLLVVHHVLFHPNLSMNSPFFPLQNAVCFIILTYLAHVLFTFYIQDVLKLKSSAKRLNTLY